MAEPATPINPPLTDVQNSSGSKTEKAVFAGGCFWGVQAVFQHTKGVTSAVSGYAGGAMPGPSYEEVSSGRKGHAELVEITFDPNQMSYGRLLQNLCMVSKQFWLEWTSEPWAGIAPTNGYSFGAPTWLQIGPINFT